MTSQRISTSLGAPFLHRIRSDPARMNGTGFPFNVPAFRDGIELEFPTPVTFFVGENGSGKSTLLEALAEICGFNPEGGNRDHLRETREDRSELAQALTLSWLPKMTEGFFMRAESFYNFASYLDGVSNFKGLWWQVTTPSVPWRVLLLHCSRIDLNTGCISWMNRRRRCHLNGSLHS